MSEDDTLPRQRKSDEVSGILPTDPFDKLLSSKIGLPNGAHTAPAVVQDVDFYGNTTQFIVQTVRTEKGAMAFVTQVNSRGSERFILPPGLLKLIDRQRGATITQVRRRHGQRIAEERGLVGHVGFTPEMRAKALATRKRKAAARRKKR